MTAIGWSAEPSTRDGENDHVLTRPTPVALARILSRLRSQSYVSPQGPKSGKLAAALLAERRVQGKQLRSNRWAGRVENARRGLVGEKNDRFDHPYGHHSRLRFGGQSGAA